MGGSSTGFPGHLVAVSDRGLVLPNLGEISARLRPAEVIETLRAGSHRWAVTAFSPPDGSPEVEVEVGDP